MSADTHGIVADDRPPTHLRRLPHHAAARTPSFQRDILILFVAPTVLLTAVFVTTAPAVFEYRAANPDLWGVYTSILAHRSSGHLAGNLLGFIVIGGVEYLLLTAAGRRTHYLTVFALSLFVVPVLSHFFLQFVLIHQPVFQTYEAVGFSATVAALTAYLPLALTTYCAEVSSFRWPYLTALLIYAGSIARATTQLFGADLGTLVIAALGLVGLAVIGNHVYRGPTLSAEARSEYGLTVVVTLTIFYLLLYTLFPGGNVGTMVGHLAGYLPGFFGPLIVFWGALNHRPDT